MYCKYNLQTNDGGGDQNVDKNTEDDFEVENDSQEDNDSDDDWFSNIYVFKFGEEYYSFHVLMNIFVDLLIFLFLLNYALISFRL